MAGLTIPLFAAALAGKHNDTERQRSCIDTSSSQESLLSGLYTDEIEHSPPSLKRNLLDMPLHQSRGSAADDRALQHSIRKQQ